MNYKKYKENLAVERYKLEESLLPKHYHQADRSWILKELSFLPSNLRLSASKRYSEIFLEAYNAEPNEIRKNGKARAAANGKFRNYVDKYR